MSKARAPIPDSAVFGDLAMAAMATARSHLKAAGSLLEHRCWPQARALAVIAFEEAGKAWLCVIASLAPDRIRQCFPFGDLDWDHVWKLSAAHLIRALLDLVRGGEGAPTSATEAMEALEDLAREDHQGKMRGLYADYRDGKVWSPSEMTEEQATAMVAVVQDVLDYAGPLVNLVHSGRVNGHVPSSVEAFLSRGAEALDGGTEVISAKYVRTVWLYPLYTGTSGQAHRNRAGATLSWSSVEEVHHKITLCRWLLVSTYYGARH